MTKRFAVIDLGTNTFQLLIAEKSLSAITPIFRSGKASKIGQGGINQGYITPEATVRALNVLTEFRQVLDRYEIAATRLRAFGTSAIRNASNREAFTTAVFEHTRIPVTVIDGDQEATYIYYGVRSALALGDRPVLVLDIGGGSVECIIANDQTIFWKQSFEIGGQRLQEKFMKNDPLTPADHSKLTDYLQEQLVPLANAIHQYAPEVLVGSSGSFDTLIDMDYQYRTNAWPPAAQNGFELPLSAFYRSYEQLLTSNRQERLALPGMTELRVDTIPIAMSLTGYLLKAFGLTRLRVSRFSLKEGVLASP